MQKSLQNQQSSPPFCSLQHWYTPTSLMFVFSKSQQKNNPIFLGVTWHSYHLNDFPSCSISLKKKTTHKTRCLLGKHPPRCSMGLEYLPIRIHEWLKFMVNIGKFSLPGTFGHVFVFSPWKFFFKLRVAFCCFLVGVCQEHVIQP